MLSKTNINRLSFAVAAVITASSGFAASDLANFDRSIMMKPANTLSKSMISHKLQTKMLDSQTRVKDEYDNRLGVATFSWNNETKTPLNAAPYSSFKQASKSASKQYLAQAGFAHGVSKASIAQAELKQVSNIGHGPIIAQYQQRVNGIEVYGRQINLMMNQKLEHIATSGSFVADSNEALKNDFSLSATEAVSAAFTDLGGNSSSIDLVKSKKSGQYQQFNVSQEKTFAIQLHKSLRTKQIYFPQGHQLIPAYYVELQGSAPESTSLLSYGYIVSAIDGEILVRNNFTKNDAQSYRVFADATGDNLPMDGPEGNALTPFPGTVFSDPVNELIQTPNLITLDHGPISTMDPWMTTATETTGNNVDAYADISTPDGFGGVDDVRAEATSPNVFDHSYGFEPVATTVEARKAAVVNLFYMNNFLHDWFYDHGFDEAAGNAQTDNYGRGGASADAIFAEGQDFSGINNANMSTPPDGGHPVMQMFLFQQGQSDIDVTGVGTLVTGSATFGPSTFEQMGTLARAIDGTPDVNDGCEAFTNATDIVGKIAVINRGACNFTQKVVNAQAVGALAAVIINQNAGEGVFTMGGSDDTITIPSVMVSKEDGDLILTAMNAGAVTATMRNVTVTRDGTLDNGIISHEWTHYLSGRLVGDGMGLNNQQAGGMGEGWSDFVALMMALRESDRNIPGNDQFQAPYSTGNYAIGNYYFGIRRTPYSTDMNVNALTFKHIEDNVALPTTHPILGDPAGSNNSEVHNTGEIWANTLWGVYVSLLNSPNHTYKEAQDLMKDYLVGGLKMTPFSPTILEARDGILAAAAATDVADFDLIFAAFARRGMGVNAVAPDRSSITNSGVVEDFTSPSSSFAVQSAVLDTNVTTAPGVDADNDGVVDVGDTAVYTINIKNKGAILLSGATAQVSSTADVSFSNNGVLNFSDMNTFGDSATANVELTLNSATTAENVVLNVSFAEVGNPADVVEPADFTTTFVANYDLNKERMSDDMEIGALSNADFSGEISNSLIKTFVLADASALSSTIGNATQLWHGADSGSEGTSALVLPKVAVKSSGEFSLSFYQYFSFEASPDQNGDVIYWDGGVMQVSINNGDWQDVTNAGGTLSTPYNHTLSDGASMIGGQMGYGGEGGDEVVTLNFPEGILNGKNVQFRFLIGTDQSVGNLGWLIDDVSFNNVEFPPFSDFVANGGTVNLPPVVSVVASSTSLMAGETVNIAATGLDAEGDVLSYQWTQISGPSVDISATENSATLSFVSPNVSATTDFVFQVVVNDGFSDSLAVQTTITVVVNTKPSVTVPASTAVTEGNVVNVAATATDAENDTLTYSWTQVSGTSVNITSTQNSATLSFVAPQVMATTSLVFEVVANDGALDSDPVQATVVVNDTPVPASTGGGGSFGWLLMLLPLLSLRKRRKI